LPLNPYQQREELLKEAIGYK